MHRTTMMLMLLLLCLPLAQATSDVWNRAAEAYKAERFSEALELFGSLEDDRPSDELYFNIGNCHYKLKAFPEAILYFEKAVKRNPRNQRAADNLELARSKMDEPVIAIDTFFLVRWIRSAALSISPLGWGIISLALLWLIAFGYIRAIRTRRVLRLREKIIPVSMLIAALVLGYISYFHTVRSDYAVVMDDTELREAPDAISPAARRLEGGEKVHLLDELDGYYKVRLVNYEVGWIPLETIERI